MDETKMKGFKGFDKDMKCHGTKYAVGESHEHKGDLALCKKGLHFCENPLDVFSYYALASSRFAEVEAEGVSDEKGGDSKRVCKKLTITAELSIHAMIDAAVKLVFSKVDMTKATENKEDKRAALNSADRGAALNSGDGGAASNSADRGAASNSGDRGAASNSGYVGAALNSGYVGAASNSGYGGAASNSGYRGAALNSADRGAALSNGDYSSADTTGKDSVAGAFGISCKARAVKGSWLVLAERKKDGTLIEVKTVKVDGKKIKPEVFYRLKKGKFIAVEE